MNFAPNTNQYKNMMLEANSTLKQLSTKLTAMTYALCKIELPSIEHVDKPKAEQAQMELAQVCMSLFDILNDILDAFGEPESVPLFTPVEEGSLQWLAIIAQHMQETVWQAYQYLDESLEQEVVWRMWSGITRFQGSLLQASVFLDEEISSMLDIQTPLLDIRNALILEAKESKRVYQWFSEQVGQITRNNTTSLNTKEMGVCLRLLKHTMTSLGQQPCYQWMYAQDKIRHIFLMRRLKTCLSDEARLMEGGPVIRDIKRFAERLQNIKRREIFSVESLQASFLGASESDVEWTRSSIRLR